MSPFDPAWEAERAPDYCDAVRAASLLAIDPVGLGGMVVRSWSGIARDGFLKGFSSLLPADVPVKKMPLNISDDRLLGGLDLTATLAAGKPINSPGILTQAQDGVVIMAMAERVTIGTAARIGAALDQGRGFAIVALDEGAGPDEAVPASLAERMAFTIAALPGEVPWPATARVAAARDKLGLISAAPEMAEQICAIASMLGVRGMRAMLYACRAARASAAFRNANEVAEEDIALAARLVLAPRATQMPQSDQSPPPPPPPPDQEEQPETDPGQAEDKQVQSLEDSVTEATETLLPQNLLDALMADLAPKRQVRGAGSSGKTESLLRGRPAPARRGALTGNARLSLLDTLRTAAPFQKLRAQTAAKRNDGPTPERRLRVRPEDFRIKRFKEQPQRVAVFAVDASGSSALNRLPEAKGAIQLMLADCYVQRDQVALIAFRGQTAEILLPPTSALARAKRSLSALPGGGGTPLATGIDAAVAMAQAMRRKGHMPFIVILTDGGANIGADGKPGRAAAAADALAAGKRCAQDKIPALVVDIAPRRQQFVQQLASQMAGRYLPLPFADARNLSRAVQNFGVDNAG